MAGALAFSACSDVDAFLNENNGNPTDAKPVLRFSASTENDDTRATIDALAIKWQAGDAILMMDGTNYSKYNLATGENSTSASFDVDGKSTAVEGANIYALYPYAAESSLTITQEEAEALCNKWGLTMDKADYCWSMYGENINYAMFDRGMRSDGDCALLLAYYKKQPYVYCPTVNVRGKRISNVVLPSVQTVAAGQTIDPKAVLMVAQADAENNLAFKNVCSYVKVTPTVECKKIEVRSNNRENLAGIFTINVADNPSVEDVYKSTNVVTLQAEEGDLAAGTYYIAVLPGTLSKGLEVRFYTGDESFNYNNRSTSFTFERNKVHAGGDSNGALATIWSNPLDYDNNQSTWYLGDEPQKVTITTGVTGPMPNGAKALNSDNTLWVRKDFDGNYFIETLASKIVPLSMRYCFAAKDEITSITGLNNFDVSDSNDFTGCFSWCGSLTSLDLSTWQIKPGAHTEDMFFYCFNLNELRINNTFHGGNGMFYDTAKDVTKCIVYGVTDERIKNMLYSSSWRSNMEFFNYTPDPDILTFTALQDNSTIKIDFSDFQYRTTNQNWSKYSANQTIKLEAGQFVQFKASSSSSFRKIGKTFSMSGLFDATGSIMSLLPEGYFMGIGAFKELFKDCTSLRTAPELPATKLIESCYESMFYGCTSLVNAPTKLPATTLAKNCYSHMFQQCTSLVNAPELPATTLAQNCYSYMFFYCTSLVNAPELPAAKLVDGCYNSMFRHCNSLESINVNLSNWNMTNPSISYWLDDVKTQGTFICPESLPEKRGDFEYIPPYWKIVRK